MHRAARYDADYEHNAYCTTLGAPQFWNNDLVLNQLQFVYQVFGQEGIEFDENRIAVFLQ